MFDQLTREQLSQLHELLYFVGQGIYSQLIGPDYMPKLPIDSIEWKLHRAEQDRNTDLMAEVYAEMTRRDAEIDRRPVDA